MAAARRVAATHPSPAVPPGGLVRRAVPQPPGRRARARTGAAVPALPVVGWTALKAGILLVAATGLPGAARSESPGHRRAVPVGLGVVLVTAGGARIAARAAARDTLAGLRMAVRAAVPRLTRRALAVLAGPVTATATAGRVHPLAVPGDGMTARARPRVTTDPVIATPAGPRTAATVPVADHGTVIAGLTAAAGRTSAPMARAAVPPAGQAVPAGHKTRQRTDRGAAAAQAGRAGPRIPGAAMAHAAGRASEAAREAAPARAAIAMTPPAAHAGTARQTPPGADRAGPAGIAMTSAAAPGMTRLAGARPVAGRAIVAVRRGRTAIAMTRAAAAGMTRLAGAQLVAGRAIVAVRRGRTAIAMTSPAAHAGTARRTRPGAGRATVTLRITTARAAAGMARLAGVQPVAGQMNATVGSAGRTPPGPSRIAEIGRAHV